MSLSKGFFQFAEKYVTPYIIIIALVAVGVSTYLDIDSRIAANYSRRVTACQSRYNSAFSSNLALRGRLTDAEREASSSLQNATAGLINTVFTLPPGSTQAERTRALLKAYAGFRVVYADYQKAEARITTERREHPLPALPAGRCG